MRTGGRETYTIKINETAGKTLEGTSVNTDPFDGKNVEMRSVFPVETQRTKSAAEKMTHLPQSHKISCRSCLRAGRPADITAHLESAADYGESAKKKKKSTSLKFNSKNEKTRAESAFHKHLVAADGERDPEKKFSDYLKWRC